MVEVGGGPVGELGLNLGGWPIIWAPEDAEAWVLNGLPKSTFCVTNAPAGTPDEVANPLGAPDLG